MARMEIIPKISDKKLEELCKRIKPVVRYVRMWFGGKSEYESDDRGDLYYIKDVDPRGVAFTWDPKKKKKAKGLEKICDIETFHTYGYYGFFKPSIAEVISQIPEEYLDEVAAFETSTDCSMDYVNDGYHATMTTLYRKRNGRRK